MGLQQRRTSSSSSSSDNSNKKLFIGIGSGIAMFLGLIIFFMAFNWQKVEGNERLVIQDWNNGVEETIIGSGTYFYVPLTTTPYTYDVGVDNFMMGHKKYYTGKGTDFADFPAFRLTTGGAGKEQIVDFSMTMQFSLDPTKLVALHNFAQDNYKNKIIKPVLIDIITNKASKLNVVDFFSGEGRVNLQQEVKKAILNAPQLADYGIKVTTFVFDGIDPDTEWLNKILARQVAIQDKLKNIEEAAAAKEAAKKKEALAEANKLERIVAAEASKQEKIKAAEATKQQTVLAAEAAAEKVRKAAAADRFRKEQDAKGLLAQGTAEARVAKLLRDSKYDGVSGARKAQVEIEQARVDMFKNMAIKGVITEKTALTIINGGKNIAPVLPVK